MPFARHEATLLRIEVVPALGASPLELLRKIAAIHASTRRLMANPFMQAACMRRCTVQCPSRATG